MNFNLTTGVDWKSLTIPACLPITTDYFPDKRSLQNDYLVSDYNLLPDDVNADFAQNRAIYKEPLSTKEVFRELVSQRLAQVSLQQLTRDLNHIICFYGAFLKWTGWAGFEMQIAKNRKDHFYFSLKWS